MAKKRKESPKAIAKRLFMEEIAKFVAEQLGHEIHDGVDYGFTNGTLVIHTPETDIQLKPIVPKALLTRYEPLPDDEEESEDEE